MPKAITRRRIDGRPIRMFAARGGSGSGSAVQTPTQDITVVDDTPGSGDDGDTNTHTITGLLHDGDVYVVAFARGVGSTAYLEISPSNFLLDGPLIGDVGCFRVGPGQGGGDTFTVTIHDGALAYHVWILRGVATAFSTPEINYNYATETVLYAAVSIVDPCEQDVTRTDSGTAVVSAPAPGSRAFYSARVEGSICTPVTPAVTIDGGSSAASGAVDTTTTYNFGTVSGGSGAVAVDAEGVGAHGVKAYLSVISIAPMDV